MISKSLLQEMLDTCVYIYSELNKFGDNISVSSEYIETYYNTDAQVVRQADRLHMKYKYISDIYKTRHNGHEWRNHRNSNQGDRERYDCHKELDKSDIIKLETLQDHITDFEGLYKRMSVFYPHLASIQLTAGQGNIKYVKSILPSDITIDSKGDDPHIWCITYKDVKFLLEATDD